MKDKLMRTLGQFSQAMLAPLTYLPAAGLLLAVGALLTSAPLSRVLPVLEWGPVRLVGRLLCSLQRGQGTFSFSSCNGVG